MADIRDRDYGMINDLSPQSAGTMTDDDDSDSRETNTQNARCLSVCLLSTCLMMTVIDITENPKREHKVNAIKTDYIRKNRDLVIFVS